MPQIKCWGCFAWQYHFMLILVGTENEVVISLCHAATISLTISSAAFYEATAVTAGYGNHYTSKSSLSSCLKELTDPCIHPQRGHPWGDVSLHTGVAKRTQNGVRAWREATPRSNEFDLNLWEKMNLRNELQAQVSHAALERHLITPPDQSLADLFILLQQGI